MFRAALLNAMLAFVHATAWLLAAAIMSLLVIIYAAVLGVGLLALAWIANAITSLITTCAC